MLNKTALLVAILAAGFVLCTYSASTDNLKQYSKRADNNSGLSIEEATKTCNQSFVIKMGRQRGFVCYFKL